MLGKCPNCNTNILEVTEGIAKIPMGNYRRIKFYLENGSQLEVPMCAECFENFDENKMDEFNTKVKTYIFNTCPESWTEKHKTKYVELFDKNKIKSIKERSGSLKSKDMNGVRIWH